MSVAAASSSTGDVAAAAVEDTPGLRQLNLGSPPGARPKPAWFPTHRQPEEVTRRLAHLEAAPSPLKVPGLFRAALDG